MNRISTPSLPVASHQTLSGRLFHATLALLVALCLSLVPTVAHAECGNFNPHAGAPAIKLPPNPNPGSWGNSWERPTIVGLWHVIYTAGGATFNDTFDTWHADGTEFESAFLPSASGNVCVGVWKPTGPRSVKLHHIGWLFNPGTPLATASNYFTLDEEVTVAEDNKSYSGKFTFKVWLLDGSASVQEVTGTMASTRITVN